MNSQPTYALKVRRMRCMNPCLIVGLTHVSHLMAEQTESCDYFSDASLTIRNGKQGFNRWDLTREILQAVETVDPDQGQVNPQRQPSL